MFELFTDHGVELLRAIGFPLWAIVVLYFGVTLGSKLGDLSKNMQEYILQTEHRLTKLETILDKEVEIMNRIDKRNED